MKILTGKKYNELLTTVKAQSEQYKEIENKLNKALYSFTKDVAYMPDANNDTYINKGYKQNLQVYSVVTAITQRCTGLPFKHFKGDKEIVNSNLIKLFGKPNPMQSQGEFIEASMSWLLLTGNLYWYTIRADNGINKGKVIEMYCLPSHITEIVGGGIMQPIKGYKLNYGYGMSDEIAASEVIHIKYFNPGYDQNGDHLYGMSPLQAALPSLNTTNSGYTALDKSYQNGAPAGMLTGVADGNLEYSEEQYKELISGYNKKAGGVNNFRKMLFSRNPMNYIAMGWSPVDMNTLEYLKFSMQDICNIYHAPIHLFSSDANTLDNYREARKAIYTDAVIPLFDRIVPIINARLCPLYEAGSIVTYDTTLISELSSDIKNLASALGTSWWLTGNERRAVMGYPEHEDPMMSEIIYPTNSLPPIEATDI